MPEDDVQVRDKMLSIGKQEGASTNGRICEMNRRVPMGWVGNIRVLFEGGASAGILSYQYQKKANNNSYILHDAKPTTIPTIDGT